MTSMASSITEPEYRATKDNLELQLVSARSVVDTFGRVFAPIEGAFHTSVADAWNAAHDAVTALEAELAGLEREWGLRLVPAWEWELVRNNID